MPRHVAEAVPQVALAGNSGYALLQLGWVQDLGFRLERCLQSQVVFNRVHHAHHIRSQAVFIISLGPAVLFWIYFNKPGTQTSGVGLQSLQDLACTLWHSCTLACRRPELL